MNAPPTGAGLRSEVRSAQTEALRQQLEQAQARLREAEDALRAIRGGEADALVIRSQVGDRVFTLNGSDSAYRVLVDALSEGALTLVDEGTIAYCNQHLAVLLGQPVSELTGAPLRDWVAAEDQADLQRLIAAGRHGTSRGELAFVRRDGRRIPIHLSCNPLQMDNGIGVCAIATDLSAQKRSEQLERLQQELHEADRRKDAFLATLAHELRNPLAPIRTAVHLLAMPNITADAQQRSVGVIQRQVKQMALLLDDLLDVARITQGKLVLKREPVALTSIVETAVEAARPLIDAKHHQLLIDQTAAQTQINADPLRLAQVLSNLLTNAAKYTDAGGRIELATRIEGTQLVFSVRDNGIGIPAGALEGIFQMFNQVQGTLNRSEGGLGIGLALIKGLVDLHGGHIEAHSAGTGHGSEFRVSLPLSTVSVAPPPSALAAAPPDAAQARRILVADDNTDAADTLAMLLKLSGYDVRVAHDGTGALRLADEFAPHVALLDIGMPDLDGYAVARELRRRPRGAELTLVALTGWGQAEDRRRAADAGFDHHLIKPVDTDQLEKLFRQPRRLPD